ncbi:MAG TPA: alpha/beta hydrolase, partial [Solirubrobacteraceae bacterium]|nr:alpha/beta hydrolase [Solirubrobacteraceae bacterium]
LVGNDTGGAIAQIAVTAAPHPQITGLVLTSCDAFEHFPPPILRPLIIAARSAAAFRAALQPLRTKRGRSFGFGALAHADIDPLVEEWAAPALARREIQRDLRELTASLERASTLAAAARLGALAIPALIAWSADDAFFALADGHRLAATIPDARFELIEHARTFSMIDQPERLADLIAGFASVPAAPGSSGAGEASAASL